MRNEGANCGVCLCFMFMFFFASARKNGRNEKFENNHKKILRVQRTGVSIEMKRRIQRNTKYERYVK